MTDSISYFSGTIGAAIGIFLLFYMIHLAIKKRNKKKQGKVE